MKTLLFALALLVTSTSTANAAALRTPGRPLLHNSEMSVVPANGTCSTANGCYRIENATSRWIVPGNTGANAGPGKALLFDSVSSGVPQGVYLGTIVQVGTWRDMVYGDIPMIQGQFVSAMEPGASAYVTVDDGVTWVLAWSLAFEPELNAVPVPVYDVRLGRVIQYTPGVATRLPGKDCKTYNNPFVSSSSPELAMVRDADCRH